MRIGFVCASVNACMCVAVCVSIKREAKGGAPPHSSFDNSTITCTLTLTLSSYRSRRSSLCRNSYSIIPIARWQRTVQAGIPRVCAVQAGNHTRSSCQRFTRYYTEDSIIVLTGFYYYYRTVLLYISIVALHRVWDRTVQAGRRLENGQKPKTTIHGKQ